jgi:hypothetical protein
LAGQLNAFANSGILATTPFVRYLPGECEFVFACSRAISSLRFSHHICPQPMKNCCSGVVLRRVLEVGRRAEAKERRRPEHVVVADDGRDVGFRLDRLDASEIGAERRGPLALDLGCGVTSCAFTAASPSASASGKQPLSAP